VPLFIERVGLCLHVVTVSAKAGVANDPEEPGTSISTGKCPEVSKGAERRFLHDIFRVVLISRQPSRQSIYAVGRMSSIDALLKDIDDVRRRQQRQIKNRRSGDGPVKL
jgi:hypothetical protein